MAKAASSVIAPVARSNARGWSMIAVAIRIRILGGDGCRALDRRILSHRQISAGQ